MAERIKASLFSNGGSQAVRLPKAFRFPGTHVFVRREGDAVVLEAVEKARWPRGHWERLSALGPISDDFELPSRLPDSPHRDAVLLGLDALETPSDGEGHGGLG